MEKVREILQYDQRTMESEKHSIVSFVIAIIIKKRIGCENAMGRERPEIRIRVKSTFGSRINLDREKYRNILDLKLPIILEDVRIRSVVSV